LETGGDFGCPVLSLFGAFCFAFCFAFCCVFLRFLRNLTANSPFSPGFSPFISAFSSPSFACLELEKRRLGWSRRRLVMIIPM
jgi:hypothetical protein